ncbi:MAG TPA: KH domain-containing protein [Desulfobacterales bacterium]|nr:KH domain-containing protein [Desulfobacterales bacterium]
MKDLIKYIVRALVDHPEQIEISETTGKQVTILELKVAKADMGKIIGKQGRNARALQVIVGAASAKVKKRTILEIIE